MDVTKLERSKREVRLPGYNFCGPGTRVFTRLTRGEKGTNPLDELCLVHAIERLKFAGDKEALLNSDRRLRLKARTLGADEERLVDNLLFFEALAKENHLWPPGLAEKEEEKKLAEGLTIPEQRLLGSLLFDKYVVGKKIDLHGLFV